ncbi:MAG TPA: hypothetical protein VK892_20575 [Pyrinomonadaceae bacterium]|nr:hypothetical protein [Pyrinomonadaceae bacterium]
MKNIFFILIATVVIFFAFSAENFAQMKQSESFLKNRANFETTVAGITLMNEESARRVLENSLQFSVTPEGKAVRTLYNMHGTQVMVLTADDPEKPFSITGIEVYRVGPSYRKLHVVMDKTPDFETESNLVVGARASWITGMRRTVSPKDLVKMLGEPNEKVKKDNKREVYVYDIADEASLGNINAARYHAEYTFYKNELVRFKFSAVPKTFKF